MTGKQNDPFAVFGEWSNPADRQAYTPLSEDGLRKRTGGNKRNVVGGTGRNLDRLFAGVADANLPESFDGQDVGAEAWANARGQVESAVDEECASSGKPPRDAI